MSLNKVMNFIERKLGLEREISRGQEAQMILGHPLVKGFFTDFEAQLVRAWKDSAPGQAGAEARDASYAMIGTLASFKNSLAHYISTAESAQTRLREANEQEEGK